jgi:CRISPR-associated protein Csy2
MTAWLGAVHALQRKLNDQGYENLAFNSAAVISHQCELQTHKGVEDFVHSIIGTGNPLDKTGARSAFIEEARCHLTVSLTIEYTGLEKDDEADLQDKITHLLNANMKIAGGDILKFKTPEFFKVENCNTKDLSALIRKLMPGYALVERRDIMTDAMTAGQDAMDALLDNLAVHHQCTKIQQENEEAIQWTSKRKNKGWIVPIATGFHGLTDLGEAKNQRDPNTPHRFAESVVTLGEFKMPHNIKSIDEILWRYQVEHTNNLYLCTQIQKLIQTEEEIENAYYA